MRTGDVFSGLRNYFTILLVSYFIFAIMETFIILTTNWILQRRPNTQHWNLVLNLRAFAGVLGLPMHLRRYGASISLQQIIMLMCICGLVFTSFFNANLSTLLTKHPQNADITNFDELRDSGLDVIFDNIFLLTIKKNYNLSAFKKIVPNAKFVPTKQYLYQILSLNCSFAYHVYTHIWNVLDNYQRSHNEIRLCRPEGMSLITNAVIRTVLKRNSIYKETFRDFMHDSQRFGYFKHWEVEAGLKMMSTVHSRLPKPLPRRTPEFKPSPLNFQDFKWLWKLLGVCYMVAGLVFIAELCVAYWQKKQARKDVIIREVVI
ncbi:uncharacterized protein LOC111597863 [Drosophila hydei]|uniref:Uncharacterized protein LOC111597863 n=1 Tax=Drosophila hydei TaxID=7224 RepID=A0A6J1LTJ3_DROHY|nr:uncharacterized protein LOC111597863 [Drosophila hydei]